jgi:hypothetical protein
VSLQDDYAALRKLLRKTAEGYPLPRPKFLEDWWAAELPVIEAEEAARAAKREARIQELAAKILELQAELERLA